MHRAVTVIRFISSLLAIAILATAATGASLRIDAGTGQFVTLCAGGQSVTVELDHTGAPIDPRPHCPDCVSVAALLLQPAALGLTGAETRLSATRHALSQTISAIPAASARAPPLLV